MDGALDKSEFMDVFYSECIEHLIAPVGGSEQQQSQSVLQQQQHSNANSSTAGDTGASSKSSSSSSTPVPASTISLIVDLLCFCVQHHAFWAKYHVLR